MTLVLDIDAHGRLVPQSDAVRRALADRAGRFALLPSAPDLVVARRTPAAGGAAPRPRCLLAGDLAGFPIADFIGFVHQSRLSGTLTVASAGVERSIAFKDGEVRAARSSALGERVGEAAVRLGFATEAQVAGCLPASRPVGRLLVERGVLSESDLWKCIQEQVTAVFHAILLSTEGTFHLMDEDPADRAGAPLPVSTQALLLEGIRRIDELSLFRARIPSPQACLRRVEARRPAPLKPPEQTLLALVDGRRTVAEIATAAHLGTFDATKVLYHLAEAGHVAAIASPAADPRARLATIAAELNGLLRLVTAAIPVPDRPAFLAAVRALLADGRQDLAPVWIRVTKAADGALDEGALLANVTTLPDATLARLEPSGDPARLLFEALRELLFFELFLAGERLGRQDDEALGLAVKERLLAVEQLVEAHP
ncbi:DUF4388 domain-containing protein [Anaeromyxobacter oryzisoli]|uniref:DUF4388 domain-containing protein n=1 Tax=Anaeromyxobacter oryzisoli TaxID=2925408 RepID=UPI001F5AF308|nr:DUF4388 domain-containing protein [Anaeromyxobacter sp. SG63]